MSEEEKKAIEKLTSGEKVTIQELMRKMKKEGIERFVVTRPEYIYIILNLIEKLLKENKELKEYIMLAPNLDEMTATKYKNIQEEAYIRGRAEEQKKAEQIMYENYITVQKVKDKIEELKKQDREWTEELPEPDSNFKIIDRNLKRIKNQIEVLQELIESEE